MGCSTLAFAVLVSFTLPHAPLALHLLRADESYIMHLKRVRIHNQYHNQWPCTGGGDGLGSNLRMTMGLIHVAMTQGLTYVCTPGDFIAAHDTGHLGFLFGCVSDSEVYGNLAAYDDVMNKSGLNFVYGDVIEFSGSPARSPSFYGEGGLSIVGGSPQSNTVYVENHCHRTSAWGQSYLWFKSQYHLVRVRDEARRNPKCGQNGRKHLIVLGIRRGDAYWATSERFPPNPIQGDPRTGKVRGDARGLASSVYARTLDKLFAGNFSTLRNIKESDSSITVIAETPEDDQEIRVFDKFTAAKVTYLLAIAEDKEWGHPQERFIRDTDCMSIADVLITSTGQYAALTSALQKVGGTTLQYTRKGAPNAIAAEEDIGEVAFDDEAAFESMPPTPNVIRVPIEEDADEVAAGAR